MAWSTELVAELDGDPIRLLRASEDQRALPRSARRLHQTVSCTELQPSVSVPACANDFQIDWKLLTSLGSKEHARTLRPAGHTITVKLTDAIGEYASSRNACQGAGVSLDLKVDFTLAPRAEAGLA